MSENAFGLDDVMGALQDGEADPLLADLVERSTQPDSAQDTPDDQGSLAPEEEGAPSSEVAPGGPPGPEAPETDEAREGPLSTEVQEVPPALYAGRFQSVDQLEQSYRSLQGEYTRSQQALNETRRELASRMEQYEAALRNLVPILENIQSEQDPEYAERLARTNELSQLIERRMKPIEQRIQDTIGQLEARQSIVGIEATVQSFRARHPEVIDGSDADYQMAEAVTELTQAWQTQGRQPDYEDPTFLELAYEASQDPYFKVAVMQSPHLVDTPQGLQYARWQARQLASFSQQSGTQAPAVQPNTAPRKVARQEAFVEDGQGDGTPPPGAPKEQPDEFDEVLRLARSKKTSAFGV